MRMSEVAERAGVPIGSLYQFFPDKGAIVRTLAERYNALGRACIEEGLADVADLDGLRDAFGRLIDIYYALFLAEPVMRDIWSGTQADKALRDIDLDDSRQTGAMLAAVLERLSPDADRAAIATRAFLIMNLGEATMRLAISVERKEGDALVAAFKQMALRELSAPAECSEVYSAGDGFFRNSAGEIVPQLDLGALSLHDHALLDDRQRVVPGPVDDEAGRERRQHEGEDHRHPGEDHRLCRIGRRRVHAHLQEHRDAHDQRPHADHQHIAARRTAAGRTG